jgi:hypothetical protein
MSIKAVTDETIKKAGWLPIVQRLVWAAGWLYPCFMATTSLARSLQEKAEATCTTCMDRAAQLLFLSLPVGGAAFLPVLEPCRRPQVPGEQYQCSG